MYPRSDRRVARGRAWVGRRSLPIVLTGVMLVVGIAYMLFWNPILHHGDGWETGGDLWGIFRGAHYVSWGFLGGIYDPSNGIVTFPGMMILLAPVAMISSSLHLTETFLPFVVPRPTAAILLQPIEILLASSVVFAVDALAEFLVIRRSRRTLLCIASAGIALPTAAVWGHAEDVLALAFAIYALLSIFRSKWNTAGWLLGLGILFQPLVLLLLPLCIGTTPAGRRMGVTVRSAALSVVLVGVAFAGNPSETYRAVVQQPTSPIVNHATPWEALAPVVSRTASHSGTVTNIVPGLGYPKVSEVATTVQGQLLVSGGVGRMIDVLVAVLIGLFVWRRPQSAVQLLWLSALVLVSRCLFEAVMTPYYVAPPLILALVLVARRPGWRLPVATGLACAISVFAYYQLSPWAWWLPIVSGLLLVLAMGYPGGIGTRRTEMDDVGDDSESFETEGPADRSASDLVLAGTQMV